MNFSEPGCAAGTNCINGSTPLHLALSLFSDMAHATKLCDFTRNLAALHDAAYILLLPEENRAEVDFRHSETTRIATGPLGDAVLQATTVFLLHACQPDIIDHDAATARTQHLDIYEVTGCMLQALAAEEERYLRNMTLLLADMKAKWKDDLIQTGSWHRTASTMGKTGIASARALADLVGARPTAPYHRRYLTEIAQHWRKWAAPTEAGVYEEVWVYVAGRALMLE